MASAVLSVPGYPTKSHLKVWYNEHQQRLDLSAATCGPEAPVLAGAAAIEHYFTRGGRIAAATKTCVIPTRTTLIALICEPLHEASEAVLKNVGTDAFRECRYERQP